MKTPYEVDFSARSGALAASAFVQRWSPRAFEKVNLEQENLDIIFDAARLGPSAFNSQPWRIFASQADASDFERFLKLLIDRNQTWAKNASIIGFMIAEKQFSANGKDNNWAEYDCGFAWASMTFQANKLGLYTHGMAGILADEVYKEFKINKDKYKVIAGFVIGKLSSPDILPDGLRKREQPSGRKALNDIYFPGGTELS